MESFDAWFAQQSKMPYRSPEEIARMAWHAARPGVKYAEREICANCQHWSSQYRYPYDAGTAAMCNKLSMQHAHLSDERTVLMDENAGDKPSIIWTRHTFGCNLFERTK